MNRVSIGTRGSPLALWQANWARAALLDRYRHLTVDIEVIQTRGDRLAEVPLAQIGGKEVWTKEIETALLNGRIDLAVHSLKDLPTRLPDGLVLGAVSVREDVRDALVGRLFEALPEGARIGTSSLRRQAQLLHLRPDLQIEAIRGNVETRLKKFETEGYDAVVLAAAGLNRLGLEGCVAEFLDADRCLPAPGQGALGIEIRAGDGRMAEYVLALNHVPTLQAVTAERAMLAALGGGCRVPIGGLAQDKNGALVLAGMVAMPDGSRLLRECATGDDAEDLGRRVAQALLSRGAGDMLAQV